MRISTLILGGFLCLLGGCGGGGGGGGSAGTPVSVVIAPATASVAPGAIHAFAATVGNTANTAVTWSVQEGAAGGAVSSAGLYTAPAATGTYHVVATSQADASKSAVATVSVHVVITVSPATVAVPLGQSQTFVATVTGSANTAVAWRIQEGTAGGTITDTGVYTPLAATGTFHVVAISQADTTQQAVATVVVQAGSATGTIQ